MADQEKTTEQLQSELAQLRQEREWGKAAESIRSEVLLMRSSGDLIKVSLKMYLHAALPPLAGIISAQALTMTVQ